MLSIFNKSLTSAFLPSLLPNIFPIVSVNQLSPNTFSIFSLILVPRSSGIRLSTHFSASLPKSLTWFHFSCIHLIGWKSPIFPSIHPLISSSDGNLINCSGLIAEFPLSWDLLVVPPFPNSFSLIHWIGCQFPTLLCIQFLKSPSDGSLINCSGLIAELPLSCDLLVVPPLNNLSFNHWIGWKLPIFCSAHFLKSSIGCQSPNIFSGLRLLLLEPPLLSACDLPNK